MKFQNVVSAGEIKDYIDVQDRMEIVPAGDVWERVRESMFGESSRGISLPYAALERKFELRQGEVTIWTGFKGHGKSLMLSHVLVEAMANDERVFVISPEFTSAGVVIRTVKQAAGIQFPDEKHANRCVNWLNDRMWLLDHQGMTPWRMVLGAIRYAREKFGVSQVLVDSLMKCGIGADDYNTQKEFIDRLQSIAHDTGLHIHMVAHARKGETDHKVAGLHDVKGASEICDMVENVVVVWKNKKKLEDPNDLKAQQGPDALIVVDSQRNGDWTGKAGLSFHPCGQFLSGNASFPRAYVK